MLDDSIVHENEAIEMEQLNFEIKPHSVMTVGLEDEDDENQDADDDGDGDEDGDAPEDNNNL